MTESKGESASWVELPVGLFTAEGIWFHTSEEDLRSFAPEVIERYGLGTLLQNAASWLALPISLSVLSLGLLLLTASPLVAAISSIVIYFLLSVVSPSTVLIGVFPVLRLLNHAIFQGLFYVLILSFLAAQGQMIALAVGLMGFILFRWQVVSRLLSSLLQTISSRMSPLEAPDLILRNIMLRSALKHGNNVGELDAMQQRMLEIMHYRKKKGK